MASAEAETQRRRVHCWEPALRSSCRPADLSDPELGPLVQDMLQIMKSKRGVGLAAPQAGDNRRVVLVRHPEDPPSHTRVLVNPEIINCSEEQCPFEEGCLSFPGIYRIVHRSRSVAVRYHDLDGHEHELNDDGFLARVVQHEIDHLDGVLFVDHLSPWERFVVRLRMMAWRWGWRR